jgi:hypothetical protein
MLDTQRIAEIAREVARTQVAEAVLERIVMEPAIDSEGREALRIILVLKPKAVQKLTGDQALDVLVGVQQKLEAEGEERFPIVEYATEQELKLGNGQA